MGHPGLVVCKTPVFDGMLPSGYRDKIPSGYIPLQADNYEGYRLLRSILKNSEAGVAKAVAWPRLYEQDHICEI